MTVKNKLARKLLKGSGITAWYIVNHGKGRLEYNLNFLKHEAKIKELTK